MGGVESTYSDLYPVALGINLPIIFTLHWNDNKGMRKYIIKEEPSSTNEITLFQYTTVASIKIMFLLFTIKEAKKY